MVHDDRRFVADHPPRRDGSPDEVHVLTQQQVLVETVERIERLPAEQQRCGRDISHPPARADNAREGTHVQRRAVPLEVVQRAGVPDRGSHPGRDGGHGRVGEVCQQGRQPTRAHLDVGVEEGHDRGGSRPPALVACRSGPSGDLALNDPSVRAAGQLRDCGGVAGAVLGHHHTGGRRRVRLERYQQRGQTLRVVAHRHDAGHVACAGTAGRRHGMGQPGLAESPPKAPRGAARRRRARAQARE